MVLLFDPDDAFGCADKIHRGSHPAQEWNGVMVEEFLVFMEEGLTLGCVGDDEGHARGEFGRCGKAATTCSDDAEFCNARDSHHI